MTRRMALGIVCAAGAYGAPAKLVLILVGPPGSGKTTQSKYLKKKYKLPVISAAELTKKSHGGKSEISKSLKVGFESGELLNDDMLNELMRGRTMKGDAIQGFVLDGYPNNRKQADYLGGLLQERGLPAPIVVLLQAPDEVARERMTKRGRADDTTEMMEARLKQYRVEEKFMMEHYAPKTLIRIDAAQTEAQVTAALQSALNQHLK